MSTFGAVATARRASLIAGTAMGIGGLLFAGVPAGASSGAPGSSRQATPVLPKPHLVVYALDAATPASSITLTIQPSGKALIVDRGKPKNYRFTLSRTALKTLKGNLARADVAHLKRSYDFPKKHPVIGCGTPAQTLTFHGSTVKVAYGPPPEPARLHRVLQQLGSIVDRQDPAGPHGAADTGRPVAHAARCGTIAG